MQKDEITLILQNPDGTIQIATQPQFKNKNVLQCYSCKIKLIYESNADFVKCSCCNAVNKVPGKASNANFVIIQCAGCNIPLKGQQDSFAIQCPICLSVTRL